MKFGLVKVNFSCRSRQADKQSNDTFQWFSGLCSGCALGLLLSADGKTGTGENITVVLSCKSCPFLAMRLLFGSRCLFSCKLAAYNSVPSCTHWTACNAALHDEKNVLPVRGVCISQERSAPNAILSSQAVNNWAIGIGGESVKTLLSALQYLLGLLRACCYALREVTWCICTTKLWKHNAECFTAGS